MIPSNLLEDCAVGDNADQPHILNTTFTAFPLYPYDPMRHLGLDAKDSGSVLAEDELFILVRNLR